MCVLTYGEGGGFKDGQNHPYIINEWPLNKKNSASFFTPFLTRLPKNKLTPSILI